jgi:hypothetical protein
VGSLSCLSIPPLFWTTTLHYAGAHVFAGNVYLCGGGNDSGIQSACWSWQPGAETWQIQLLNVESFNGETLNVESFIVESLNAESFNFESFNNENHVTANHLTAKIFKSRIL